MTITSTPPDQATSGADTEDQVGFFIVSYQIGGEMPGASSFVVHLTVNTPARTITGQGRITNYSILPPLDLSTKLHGDFTYMTVEPPSTSILVNLTGYPVVSWPPGIGIGPVIPADVDLRMVLDGSWQSGTANYRYTRDGQTWRSVSNAPVHKIEPPTGTANSTVAGVGGNTPRVVLNPESASASWSDGELVIHAAGHEEGLGNIRVVKLPTQIFPPQFSVVGNESPAIGYFPYTVTGRFAMGSKPAYVFLVTRFGTRQLPVT